MSGVHIHLWKRLGTAFLAVAVTVTAFLGAALPEKAEAADQFTVYLQAGHSPSAYGLGNVQNGLRESVLNEQVTIKTYNALRARGINVILLNPISLDPSLPSVIKDKPAKNEQYSYYSPEPAMLTAATWPERFDSSLTRQADLLISLHHNAYSNTSIRGYEIYYASTVGGDYGRTAQDVEGSRKIAQYINEEFAKGFHVPARSPAVRDNSTNNGLTKSAPMPTVLVEAGYMSNASDLSALRSETNQQSMADKIADAVVKYKKEYWNQDDSVDIRTSALEATYNKADETISVKTTLTPADDVAGAVMKVWPEAIGTSAEKTYELTSLGSGKYSARISLEPFAYAVGKYCISIYGREESGSTQIAGTTEVNVTGSNVLPTASSVTAKLLSPSSNSAVLTVKGATAPAGVSKVEFAVWSDTNGQDDLEWYTATKSGSDWTATMRTTDLLDRPGLYNVHAYVTDKRGTRQMVGDTTVTFAHKEGDIPELYGDLTYRKVGTKLILTAKDVRDASGVKGVRFALWGTASQQRDLTWYNALKSGTSWSSVVNLNSHPAEDERYTVHVYAEDTKGNDGCIAALEFRLGTDTKAPSADSVSVVEQMDGSAVVYVNGVKDDWSGVSGVELAVWTQKSSQDDLKWYKVQQNASGEWTAKFSSAQHKNEKGPYHIVAYGTDAAGNRGLVARTTFTFTGNADTTPPTAGKVIADRSVYTGQAASVNITGVTDPSGVASVRVEVLRKDAKSPSGTYEAELQKNGSWTASFSWGGGFTETGEYVIRAYAADKAGNTASVGETTVRVENTAISGFPIMGKSQATVAQLVNMQMSAGWSNGWYRMTVEEFCQMYYDICEAEGVRVEVAYAQMLHETGSLKYGNLVERSQLNFAGLGSTGLEVAKEKQKATHRYTSDNLDAGIVFKSVENGIRSQVQHLKGYASTEELNLPMAAEYDRFGYMERGCAPTLQLLSQKWATDEAYGDQMYAYVEKILAQSTKMPSINTVIPAATDAPSPTPKPTAAATAAPGVKGEVAPEPKALEEWEAEVTSETVPVPYQAPIPVPEAEASQSTEPATYTDDDAA